MKTCSILFNDNNLTRYINSQAHCLALPYAPLSSLDAARLLYNFICIHYI